MKLLDLAGERRWCAWRTEFRGPKNEPTKVPYSAGWASWKSNDPTTWITRAEAQSLGAGVGIALGPLGAGRILAGIDYDSCIGAEVAQWALEAIHSAGGGHVEVSPSGAGLKQFVLVSDGLASDVAAGLFGTSGKRGGTVEKKPNPDGGKAVGIEAYLGLRFFTVTDDLLFGTDDLAELTVAGAEGVRQAGLLIPSPAALSTDKGGLTNASLWMPATGEASEIVARVAAAAQLRPVIAALLVDDRSVLGKKQSNSEVAWAISGQLADAGWTDEERIAVLTTHPLPALEEWREKHSQLGDWSRQLRRTIEGNEKSTPGRGEARALGPIVESVTLEGEIEGNSRPVVNVSAPIHIVVNDAEIAVAASGLPVFKRSGELVRPMLIDAIGVDGQKTTTAAFTIIDKDAAVDLLSKSADWSKYDGRSKKEVQCNPPKDVAAVWLARKGDWRAPAVRGIITVPTLRWDGSLITAPGFDPVSGFYMMPDASVRMPGGVWNTTPVKADAEAAIDLLAELLGEFPFPSDADRAVALSGFLTTVSRAAMAACPLHAFSAPDPASGKTYLVRVITAPVLGRAPPVSTAGKDEAETEKRLGSLLMSGVPVGVIDNVNGTLEGDLLCQACDLPSFSIRVLGLSKMREVDNTISLFATGNNLTIIGDLVRRALVSLLVSGMERPETRTFRSDPLRAALANRGKFLAAALTVVRAHILAGYPGCAGLRPLGSFEDWGRLVRGPLNWLGRGDPVNTIDRAYNEDPNRADLRVFLKTWFLLFKTNEKTVRQVIELINNPAMNTNNERVKDTVDQVNVLREILLKVAGRNNIIDTARVGYWLRRHKGKHMAGYTLKDTTAKNHDNLTHWLVERGAGYVKSIESE